jgi:Tfp pilus assembly protein PilW
MTNTRLLSGQRPRRAGFTIGEMLVYMVVSSFVLLGMYRVMQGQGRGYSQQVAATDVDESARSAASMLAWELRHAAMAGDTLSTIGAHSVAMRSVQGVGVICAKHATLPRYGIWKNGGDIQATSDDSALVYVVGSQKWRQLKIAQVGTTAALGVSSCAWTGGRAPDLVVEFTVGSAKDTLGIKVGALVRAFRKVKYSEFQDQGRWWFGRRVGSGNYEKLTGPLLDSASNGLTLSYFTSTGTTTTTPSAVSVVKVQIRTESTKPYRKLRGRPAFRYDSITTKVALRR